jgi:ribosome-binding ATPase
MSSLRCGIIGLPNVGKSTLFNALTKQAAKAQNVPFTTIEPNVGIVAVPDERLERLAAISKSAKIVPTTIEFVDIAGLIRGAHKGEGLGNKFLSNIREVDAIVHVVRVFEGGGITHVETSVDPARDVETINTELALADLDTVQRMRMNLEKKIKGQDKDAASLDAVLAKFEGALAEGNPARSVQLGEKEALIARSVQLLTNKPVLYVANVDEQQLQTPLSLPLKEGEKTLALSIKIEQELVELPEEERQIFLAEYGLHNTGLERLIQASYELLGLITFLTSGPQETRAWTVRREAKAPEAAGKIHSDIERGFIRAETVAYEDLIQAGSYAAARSAGKVRDEGKEYLVQDGDIMLFKHST